MTKAVSICSPLVFKVSVMKIKLPKIKKPDFGNSKDKASVSRKEKESYEFDDSQAKKIWMAEIGFGLVASFAAVLIALAG